MICSECGNETYQDPERTEGICWPCNDKKIMEKWNLSVKNDTTHVNKVRQRPSIESIILQPIVDHILTNLNNYKPVPKTTLPADSAERKNYPLFRGLLRYFPAALAGVARTSQKGNDKHNPGEELHHARGKSTDHGDCVLRHLMDLADLLAARDRGTEVSDQQILDEANSMAWRVLALSQELHEKLNGSPMAPGAKE